MNLLNNKALLCALWLSAVFAVVAGELVPPGFPVLVAMGQMHISDKLLHFGAYMALSVFPILIFNSVAGMTLTVLSVEALGIVLEFAQRLVPGRSFEFADMLANTVGVLCGVTLALSWRRLRYHTVS